MNIQNAKNQFLALLRAALAGAHVTLTREDVIEAYPLARKHALDGALYPTVSALLGEENVPLEYQRAFEKVLFSSTVQSEARESLLSCFDREGIAALPIKGSDIAELYPENFLRASSDIDILVSSDDLKAAGEILSELGYSSAERTEHDITYRRPPCIAIELHFSLLHESSLNYSYFEDVIGRGRVREGYLHIKRMTPADEYLYLLEHAYKHQTSFGAGVRMVLDIGAFAERYADVVASAEVRTLVKRLSLDAFEDVMRKLYRGFLYGDALDERHRVLADHILSMGLYGSFENYIATDAKGKTRLGYILSRTFISLHRMRILYPWCKTPLHYPFAFVARLIRFLRSGKVKANLKGVSASDGTRVRELSSMWRAVGVEFREEKV